MSPKLHELYMRRCLELASKGRPFVQTNPLVGSCVVYNNRIIGEGFHREFGKAHAEINALQDVRAEDRHLIRESTLYVNLEPCNHHGKTPACSRAIIESGCRKVVIGMPDPNPEAAGGIEALRQEGIEVTTGILQRTCEEVNRTFLVNIKLNRPFVTLKWAQSGDGFIGKPDRRVLISNDLTQLFTHDLRRRHNAILVGAGTIRVDDPSLTTRAVPGPNPLRVILAGIKGISAESSVMCDGKPTVVFSFSTSSDNLSEVTYITHKQIFVNSIEEMLTILYTEYHVGNLLVEGGARVLDSFITSGYWDRCYRITSPGMLESGVKAPIIEGKHVDTVSLHVDRIELIDSF